MQQAAPAPITRQKVYLVVALFALALAASTGVLIRFGLVSGFPTWANNYTAMRHAHSHLMYFGWGTLAIMALMWAWLPGQTGLPLPRGTGWQLGLTALLSLLSFPAFWANGYGSTEILGRSLPLGSMAAALNGLPWFFFAWLYARATRNLRVRSLALQLWDWALLLLMLASAGALGLGLQVALGVESHALREASLHLFLDLFATGWFTLATLGLLWAWVGTDQQPRGWMPTQSVGICLGVTFVLGMSPAVVSPFLFWFAAMMNAVAALLLARHLWALSQRRAHLPLATRFGLLMFAAYLLTALAILAPELWRWSSGTQLRVFYLHLLLLGWMSSALIGLVLSALGFFSARVQRGMAWAWNAGVGVLLLALLGLGLASVIPISPIFWLRLSAWSSIVPATVATVAFLLAALGLVWRGADAPTAAPRSPHTAQASE